MSDPKYATLGDIAKELEKMKEDGMTKASVLYALGRVYWEEDTRAGNEGPDYNFEGGIEA